MKKKPLTMFWKKAKILSEENNKEKAVPMLERMIIYLANSSAKGIKEIEGVQVDLWKERAWQHLELMDCLPDYKEEKIK